MTTLCFFQITRPTRVSDDNILTNNLCKPHFAGILVTQVSDHFMHFCIIKEGKNNYPKYLNNFKRVILKSNIYENPKKFQIPIYIVTYWL